MIFNLVFFFFQGHLLLYTVLLIKRGKRENLGIIFYIILQNVSCDQSLEQSSRDGSNEESQYVFLEN